MRPDSVKPYLDWRMMMFNFIRKHFAIKTTSLDEFVSVAKREGIAAVTGQTACVARGASNTWSVGAIGNFQYILEFSAVTPTGRKVTYAQQLFERFGSDRGFADAPERRNASIRLFLLAEREVKTVQEMLPGITVTLMGPSGPMNESMFERLHQDAAKCSVSI